tara:strand:- start:333 stop:647 length:315 start_codon:yes stop_codon:yes gene_type:complete
MKQYIYFFKEEAIGSVKIGLSYDVPKRLEQIQMYSPQRLKFSGHLPGNLAKEKEIHKRFSHLRIHGEWFHLDEELSAFIESTDQTMPSSPPCKTKPKRVRKILS